MKAYTLEELRNLPHGLCKDPLEVKGVREDRWYTFEEITKLPLRQDEIIWVGFQLLELEQNRNVHAKLASEILRELGYGFEARLKLLNWKGRGFKLWDIYRQALFETALLAKDERVFNKQLIKHLIKLLS